MPYRNLEQNPNTLFYPYKLDRERALKFSTFLNGLEDKEAKLKHFDTMKKCVIRDQDEYFGDKFGDSLFNALVSFSFVFIVPVVQSSLIAFGLLTNPHLQLIIFACVAALSLIACVGNIVNSIALKFDHKEEKRTFEEAFNKNESDLINVYTSLPDKFQDNELEAACIALKIS